MNANTMMNSTKQKRKNNKTTFERLRPNLSKFFALLLLALLVFTKPNFYSELASDLIEIAGFALLISAGLGRVWCTLYIAGRKDKVLCTTGPYSLCRNPLYFFSFLGLVGFVVATNHLVYASMVAIIFLIYYHYVIKKEEKRLLELFGEQFQTYQSNTNRFFPALKKPDRSQDGFPMNYHVFEKSLRDISGFFIAILLVELIEIIQELTGFHFISMPI
jgi:protein-S-isoprenylcysteine O-methyltransferase Ste14